MARQVLPIVGAIVGAFFGAPQLGYAIGAIIGNAVDPQVFKGPKLGEAGLQTSAEGVFRPIVRGKAGVKGNVIARGNRQVKTKRTSQGKGSGPVTEEQRVYWTFAIRIGEPVSAYLRIWQDEKLVYDVTPESTIEEETAEYSSRLRFYYGDEDQLPDPDFEAFMGEGNVNAYRGTAYVVFPNFDLTDYREMIPQFRFEVMSEPEVNPALPVMAVGNTGAAARYYASSADGNSPWSIVNNVTVSAGGNLLLPLNRGRVLSYSTNSAAYTDDFGVTWTVVDEDFSGAGLVGGAARGDLVMIGSGISGTNISTDNGESFNLVPGARAEYISFAGGTGAAIGAGLYDAEAYLIDNSGGYEFGGAHELNFTLGGCSSAVPNGVMFGANDPVTGLAAVSRTSTGSAFGLEVLPAGASTICTALCWNGDSENPIIVAGGNQDGECWVSVNNASFVSAGNTMGSDIEVTDIGFNGTQFIYAGRTLEVPHIGVIFTSTDGVILTEQTHPLGYSVDSIAASPPYGAGVEGQPIPLSAIVAELHERSGHTSNQYDVSELNDLVEGIVFAGDYTAADAIRTLMPVYKFDASEYDSGTGYRVHYPKRGKPVVGVVTESDLIEAQEKTVREDSMELPRKLHLHYENPTVAYVPAKATAFRSSPDVKVVGEKSLQIPVAFSDVDEPAKIVNRLMKIVYVEKDGEEEFTVSDRLLEWVPADCIGLTLRGQTRRMRIVLEEIGPGEIKWKLLPDRQSAYTSSVTGVPVPPPTPPRPSIVGQTIHEFMDLPALNDGDDRLIWYEAATGQTPAWYGAQTQRKTGASLEFEDSATFTQHTIMGILLDPITSASEYFTDTTNVVRVQLYTDDSLDSLTDAQFLSEGGAFALKNDDGSWEILQYRDSDDEGDGVFALTYLARGRLNTGGTAHSAGSRFVLLEGVQAVDAVSAWINTDIVMRAVSFGTSPESAPQTTNPYVGKSQIEFPVADLLLERDGDELSVVVIPRHRFGTELNPIRSINWSGYRLSVTDGSTTINLDTLNDATTFDVTGMGSPITVTAAQINRITGPGPAVSEDIA